MRLRVFRTTDIVLIAVMLAAAAFTYGTKHEAENRLTRIREIEARIELEKDRIDVLRADWSLLTQPSRLQRLTEIYDSELEFEPVEAHQIADLDALPARPIEIEDLIEQDGREMVDSVQDPTITGGVAQ